MLRESSKLEGNEANLLSLAGHGETAGCLPGEAELIAFADAVMAEDKDNITQARQAVESQLGPAAMVDAAAVIANFQRMVRIADATGIPLDAPVAMMTADIRDTLNLDKFGSAERTPRVGFAGRLLGRLITPVLPSLFRRMTTAGDNEELKS